MRITITTNKTYVPPTCAVHEIQPEGSLCMSLQRFSLQQLEEDETFEYEW